MKDLIQEINELIQSIDQTTMQFYQQHTQEGYAKLADTLTKLIKTLGDITEHKTSLNITEIDINDTNNILNKALLALEEKDFILFSDILQYELKVLLVDIIHTL